MELLFVYMLGSDTATGSDDCLKELDCRLYRSRCSVGVLNRNIPKGFKTNARLYTLVVLHNLRFIHTRLLLLSLFGR